MRRTMHAAAILLACATQLQAQSPSDKVPNSAQRSSLVRTENASESTEMNEASMPSAAAEHGSGPQFMQQDSGRAYSQLGSFLQCNDWRPNLWNGYQCERAAVVSRISQHIDMTCQCFQSHSSKSRINLYAKACDPCAGACGSDCTGLTCKLGSIKKVRNRYREPMSTLCGSASDACGSSCGSTCAQPMSGGCETGAACGQGSCGSLSVQQTSDANATQVTPASTAKTPVLDKIIATRDRVATPVINNPRAASNGQNRSSLFEMHR